jgi:hypothetical protein
MKALQMLKFTINGGNQLNFTAGLGWEAELHELEGLDYLDSYILEDLATFHHNLISSLDSDNSSILSNKSDLKIK